MVGDLALFATVTLGPVGIIIQPMLLGPPLLLHEIVLKRHGVTSPGNEQGDGGRTDSRQLVYCSPSPPSWARAHDVPRAFGVLSGDIPGVLRGSSTSRFRAH